MSRGVLDWLLKSLDLCYNWRGEKLFKGELRDCGRRFKIEMCQNEATHYLLVSVLIA